MDAQSETVSRYYQLVDAANYEPLFAMFCDDIVYERAGRGPIDGMADFRRFYLSDRRIRSGRHDVEAILGNGDWVAARGTFTGELRTGETVTTRWADFHRFRGAKIWRRYTYFADQAV